jgi:hypothetical protein
MARLQAKCPSKTALQKDQAADLSVEEMADFYGVTCGTIVKWFSNHGISRKIINTDKTDDVQVGKATVVAIDTDDDGVITFAVPGGGTVVGIEAAERLGAIMNSFWTQRDS